MIRHLAIRNLAVIESITVDFEPSFNVLTGETGAGKSILVEAVGLLLGGRASADLVRTGEALATIEALFETGPAGRAGAAGEEARREIAVRREITAQGRSRAFIDGALATAAALKDLAQRLVELHGQHEHQQLLDAEQHLGVLDVWAGLDDRADEAAGAYRTVRTLRERLDRLRMDSRERAARLELVEFQLAELTAARLQPGEDEELGARRQVLRSADRIDRLCRESYAELYEAEGSVLTGLGHVWTRVEELAAIDSRFTPHLQQRESIAALLDDLALTLRDVAGSLDASPGRLEEVEARLALLERLKRKHGPALEDVIRKRDTLAAEHAALSGPESTAEQVERELASAAADFLDRARDLSRARHAAARPFTDALGAELGELAMAQARFEVRLATVEDAAGWTERGIDTAEFYFSANPGEDLRPLASVVSGGELSRVMLALKTLASADTGRTLIFDEVDAGIGGRVATAVGERLRALGRASQVLCITHLPQIAAAGDTHFHIEKIVRGARTVTSVRRLDEAARVDELARLMGGADAGGRTRDSARELLDAARARRAPPTKAKGESAAGRKRKYN